MEKFRSFSPCRTGDHRTWDLWNLWHYFCHAARRDRLFRIQEKFQRSGTDRCIPGIFVKGGMGLTSFVIGAFLKNGGYVANAVQTDKALSYIEVCFIWIPVVLCVIIAVLTWFYKLDSLRSEMTEELESRRRKIANGNERCDF